MQVKDHDFGSDRRWRQQGQRRYGAHSQLILADDGVSKHRAGIPLETACCPGGITLCCRDTIRIGFCTSHAKGIFEQGRRFAPIGVLSIPPTLAYLRRRRAGGLPTDEMIGKVRRRLLIELLLFVPLLAVAAAMARGYGEV